MTKKRKKVRGKGRYYLLWILILIGVFFGSQKAVVYLKDNDFFKIKHITIRGNQLVNIEYLHSIAEPLVGTSIFEVEAFDLPLRYQALSRIKSVKYHKIFPSKLVITVNERRGLFYIKDTSGDIHPIDADKVILDTADWYLGEDIPLINITIPKEKIIVGSQLNDPRIDYVLQVYQSITSSSTNLLPDISEFYFRDKYLYFVDMKSGCRVILSPENISDQLNRFKFLRDNQGFERNSTIDLRFDKQVIIS